MTTESERAKMQKIGIKHCTKHDVEYKYPFKCPRCEMEDQQEYDRMYPHVDMEVRYHHPYTHTRNAMFIMVGGDPVPFAKAHFFCGWSPMPASLVAFDKITLGEKQIPTFATASEEGTIQPVVYFDREQVHKAMTLLLEWYESTGHLVGIDKPADLCIGF